MEMLQQYANKNMYDGQEINVRHRGKIMTRMANLSRNCAAEDRIGGHSGR
ncbi:MAG: hypothetical protein WBB19_11570 [Desulforhopalus sp.]